MKLYAKDVALYRKANAELNDKQKTGKDISDAGALFRALVLHGEIDRFIKRNRIRKEEVAMICHKNGRMYLQWAGALPAGMPSEKLT